MDYNKIFKTKRNRDEETEDKPKKAKKNKKDKDFVDSGSDSELEEERKEMEEQRKQEEDERAISQLFCLRKEIINKKGEPETKIEEIHVKINENDITIKGFERILRSKYDDFKSVGLSFSIDKRPELKLNDDYFFYKNFKQYGGIHDPSRTAILIKTVSDKKGDEKKDKKKKPKKEESKKEEEKQKKEEIKQEDKKE